MPYAHSTHTPPLIRVDTSRKIDFNRYSYNMPNELKCPFIDIGCIHQQDVATSVTMHKFTRTKEEMRDEEKIKTSKQSFVQFPMK